MARGAYAVVNSEARTPSSCEIPSRMPRQRSGARYRPHSDRTPALSFVLQVKSPLALHTRSGRIGLPKNRAVNGPEDIMAEGLRAEEGAEKTSV